MFVSHFFTEESYVVVVLGKIFFIWEAKKKAAGHVRQVVILYNDCMGICLGGLAIGHLR